VRSDFPSCEMVVEGGSTDGTVELAARYATAIGSLTGRATQMNAGAAVSSGDVLWFIHADCQVPADALELLRQALRAGSWCGRRRPATELRSTQCGSGLSGDQLQRAARRLSWIFGDQAMFVRREVFGAVGEFPKLPLMEDLEMSRILRRRGRLVVLPTTVSASARRLVEQGVWRMTVLMQLLKLQYLLVVDPERIRRRYEAGTRRGSWRQLAPTRSDPAG
jgi:glycosyltransferase involved in cell wall biosynthesis